jgi:hypothetical protein
VRLTVASGIAGAVTGLLESRIAPAAFARLGTRFRPDGAYLVRGDLGTRTNPPRLDVEELVPLEARPGVR